MIDFKTDWYVLSIAWKWLDEKTVHTLCLNDFPEDYKKNQEDDKKLMFKLWELFNEADILIGHNSDQFDIPKANARFLIHGFKPPTPYRTFDTLKVARNKFKFDSNKLDDLGRCLGVGRKLPHTGFHLWQSCMRGDAKAWTLMKKYNGQDVLLLERVYLLVLPWSTTHPNVTIDKAACPKCSSVSIQRRGFSYTLSGIKKQRYQCNNCNGWFEGNLLKEKK